MRRKSAALIFILIAAFLFSSCADDGRAEAVLHPDDGEYAFNYLDGIFDVDVASPQAFVYDVNSDAVIFSKGEDKVVYPGSTAKLLTALYALTVLSPDEVITAGDELELVKPGSSIAYIKKGHRLSVEMLIEGMLIPSGNDAAYVLAAAVGRKTAGDASLGAQKAISAFIEGVNAYAAEIGLCGTEITVPDGYAYEEQYTTTEDMLLICRSAAKNEIIAKYASMHTDSVVYASGHTNTWTNTNLLLDKNSSYYSPFATGLKTGSINGEYSLVFTFKYADGREYIAGVFGADSKNTRFGDACKIIEMLEIHA